VIVLSEPLPGAPAAVLIETLRRGRCPVLVPDRRGWLDPIVIESPAPALPGLDTRRVLARAEALRIADEGRN
jgi:hypothetical protein